MKTLTAAALVVLAAAVARGGPAGDATDGTIDALVARGEKEFDAGQRDAAVATFQSALEREPGHRNATMALGKAYLRMSQFELAVPLLERILKAEPANFVVMNNLAWLHAVATAPALFNPAEAVRLARAALALAPSDYHVWSTYAEALYVHGEYAAALHAAQQTLRLAELDPAAGEALGAYRGQIAKCSQAVRALALVE